MAGVRVPRIRGLGMGGLGPQLAAIRPCLSFFGSAVFAVLSKNGKNGTQIAGNSRGGVCGCVPSIQPPPLPSRPPCNTEYVVPTVVPIYGCISPSTTNKNSPLYQKQHKIFAHSQISAHMLVSLTQLDILLSSPQHQNACRKNKGLETTLRV